MAARVEIQSPPSSLFDCRYTAEKLTAVLAAIDEASERTSDLHSLLGAEGVYALTSELLPHAIKMGRQLATGLRQLEGLDSGRA